MQRAEAGVNIRIELRRVVHAQQELVQAQIVVANLDVALRLIEEPVCVHHLVVDGW